MSAVVAALDKHTPSSIGENGHRQYTWSHDLTEKIVQLSFQLTRTAKETVRTTLAQKFREILSGLPLTAETDSGENILSLVVRMIGHTRDIVGGKGEYELSYMLVYELHRFYPELAQGVLQSFLESSGSSDSECDSHPYGSWKDVKYFCNYCAEMGGALHPLIDFAHGIALKQLRTDWQRYSVRTSNDSCPRLSLAARWLPREKSKKFGWQFHRLAEAFFSDWLAEPAGLVPLERHAWLDRAKTKCYTHFRLVLATLNKQLDTLQVKQCKNTWSEIDYAHVTSITLRRQGKALRNVKANDPSTERCASEDRRTCAENFRKFMERAAAGKAVVKGKRVSLIDFARSAHGNGDEDDCKLINEQWKDNATQTGALPDFIPMIDTSGSMTCDNSVPLYSAVGLGIRIAEKSKLGQRAMTFSAQPRWIDYSACKGFTDKVRATFAGDWGMNTNFTAALTLILDAIKSARLLPEEVENMVLVILSDMQIDCAGNERIDESMHSHIKRLYEEAGVQLHGRPFRPPGILFWNLRSTTGFPTLSAQENVFMMSGTSPALLNLFCETGVSALREHTPWRMFVESLCHARYAPLKSMTDEFIARC